MEAVLPKSVNYLDTLPKAVPSERKRKNFFAANGTQYRPGQTMIIEVSDGRAFLDPHNSFLRFTVTNQGANNMVPELGGGQAFIRNFRVQQNGNTIMNIQAYNRLYCGIIAPTTGGNQWRAATSVYENVAGYGTQTGAAATSNVPAPVLEFNGGHATSSNVPSLNNPMATMEFCVPLIGGLFSQSKLIPLPLVSQNQPIQLIFDLETEDNCVVWDAQPAGPADLLISNVRYCAEMVEVPRDVLGYLSQQQAAHGGSLIIQASSYEFSNGVLAAGATGAHIINIPSRKRSIKSIQFVAMANATTIINFAAAAGSGIPAGSGPWGVFNLSTSNNPCIASYQLRAGSLVMPPTAIQGPGGRNNGVVGLPGAPRAGNITVAGLPNEDSNKGEAAFEMAKALGHLGSTMGMGGCSRLTYANSDQVGFGNTGTNWVCGQGMAGAGADFICGPEGLAPGAPSVGDQWKFSPFAIDLEAYQHQAIDSGLDTKTLSLQMTLHLEIDNVLSIPDTGGGGFAAAAGQSSPVQFDIYTYHDILYYFNSDGSITYSE